MIDIYDYETFNLIDSNEYVNIQNNNVYTNARIKIVMTAAIQVIDILNIKALNEWKDIMNNIDILEDSESRIILEYTRFNATTFVKQDISLQVIDRC